MTWPAPEDTRAAARCPRSPTEPSLKNAALRGPAHSRCQLPLHERRRNPEHAVPRAAELLIPPRVRPGQVRVQHIPVHLHDERGLASQEVHDVLADDLLAPKLRRGAARGWQTRGAPQSRWGGAA